MTATSVGSIARRIMAALPFPEDGYDPLPPREPEVRVVPETREEIRNAWTTALVDQVYAEANLPKVAKDRFRGKPLLRLTTQDEGCAEFPHIERREVRASCAALYREGGWVTLWSRSYGTGKTTFALWHVLRYLRLEAERRADEGIPCSVLEHDRHPMPKVVFGSWRRFIGLLKAEMNRPFAGSVISSLRSADLLILDDLQAMTAWEHGVLDDLLGDRYASLGKTMLIAGGLASPDALNDVVGSRAMSFVDERGCLVHVGGQGFRTRRVESDSIVIPL